jgi:hypothetical protein
MSNERISRLSRYVSGALAAGALLIGLPARPAFAAAPATPEEARMMSYQASERAAQYADSAAAGSLYKSGLIQREENEATRYAALADRMAAPAPARSPSAEHFAALAAHYRFIGGAAYKVGLVQWAEAEQRRAAEADAVAAGAPPAAQETSLEPNPICLTEKPIVQIACGD